MSARINNNALNFTTTTPLTLDFTAWDHLTFRGTVSEMVGSCQSQYVERGMKEGTLCKSNKTSYTTEREETAERMMKRRKKNGNQRQ